MKLETEVAFQYDDADTANNIARLIEIDNTIAPKTLSITTLAAEKRVVTRIKSKKAATFFATIDDLMFTEKLIASLYKTSKNL